MDTERLKASGSIQRSKHWDRDLGVGRRDDQSLLELQGFRTWRKAVTKVGLEGQGILDVEQATPKMGAGRIQSWTL